MHALLAEENAWLPKDQHTLASGASAALRPSGLYMAQMGDGLFGNTRLGTLWARSWEADETIFTLTGDLSPDAPPRVTTEFFPLGPGDAFLFLPGVNGDQVPEEWLSAALDVNPDLEAVGELLRGATPTTAGMVIWWPDSEHEVGGSWTRWSSASGTKLVPFRRTAPSPAPPIEPELRGQPEREAAPPPMFAVPPRTMPAEPLPEVVAAAPEPGRWDVSAEPQLAEPQPDFEPRLEAATTTGASQAWALEQAEEPIAPRRERRNPLVGNPRAIALGGAAALILVILVGVGLARGLTPDSTVPESSALINRAAGASDRNVAVGYLDEAISKLQPRAERDQSALSLLGNAQASRDRLLDVVRVGEIERFALPAPSGQARPLGIWKSEDSLFMLDLGSQLLYRSDLSGSRLEVAVKPGDSYADQPLGRFASGAYSAPRGVNTDGRLLLVETSRSILSISPSGTRRWWPPDSDQWARIGPTAATFDDLYLIDSGKGQIWQYPARVALARASVAATVRDEPRLSQAIDLATDGNLYLLFGDGAIRKLAPGGGGLPFDGRVPGQPLAAPIAIFAHPDLDRVWVLEPAASRVVEFTPGGDYTRQYVFPPNLVRQGLGLHVDGQTDELRVLTVEHVLSVKMR